MPNSIVQSFRRQFPGDRRTDDELTLEIGRVYPEYSDPNKFPDFHSDLQRLTQKAQPQPASETPLEIEPYPATVGQYFRQGLGSGIRGFASTLGSIPEAVGSAARIAGTYSVPGAEYVPMRFDTEPGVLETGLTQLGDRFSPEPVPGLEKSFLATTVPSGVGSGAAFIAGGAAAGAAEVGIIRAIGTRAVARAAAAGALEADALAAGQAAMKSAATRLAYGNIASLGALSQAQQGYEEARKAGVDEHGRFLAFALNLPVGMTEAVPLANMLNRMDKLSGGTLKHALVDAAVDTFEEALQNSFQGVAGDVIASKLAKYEPDRKLFSSLAEDAAGGGISAAILSLATSAIGVKLHGGSTPSRTPPPSTVARGTAAEGTSAMTPPPAAPDVAAQYATPEQRAQEHAARMLEVSRRMVFGGFGAEDTGFVSSLQPNEQVIYQGLVDQARKEKDAIDQRIVQQSDQSQRSGNVGVVQTEGINREREAAEQAARAAGGAGGGVPQGGAIPAGGLASDQPAVAPEKEVVAPAPPPLAPVLFHSAVVLPGIAPVIYYTPTADLRGADGGIYKPGDALTAQNLAGFTIPIDELTKANAEVAKQQQTKPIAAPAAVGTPYLPPPAGLSPELESLAQKAASPTAGRFTAQENALLQSLGSIPETQKIYLDRVATLRGITPTPFVPAVQPPVAATAPAPPAAKPARPPMPSPVPSIGNVYVPGLGQPAPKGLAARARAKAVALATTLKRKVAAVIHASPILDRIDFDGDSPLTFELSGRGAAAGETTLSPVGAGEVLVSAGLHEGQRGNVIQKGETESTIKLKNGDVIKVENDEYKLLTDIRKEMQEGTGAKVTLAPAYFELTETPAGNDKALQAAGLVSRASMTGKKVERGSRNTWTHRWTVFREGNRIHFLPTYKSEGKIMAAEAGKKKGTPVVELMKRGYTPIASFRSKDAEHAIDAPKPVSGADEHERTFASHARERMAAAARTYAAVRATLEPTQPGEVEETIDVAGRKLGLPGTVAETAPGGAAEPATGPVLPVEVVFSANLANDLFPSLTEALAQTGKGKHPQLSVHDDATNKAVARYAVKGKYGKEIRDLAIELAGDIGAPDASRAILDRIVGSYNDSRTSAEFAQALSRPGRAGAVAAGGVAGLPGAQPGGAERGRSQPTTTVSPPSQNAGVAGSTPTTVSQSWARSQPKFRAADGGYTTAAGVMGKLYDLLDTLAIAGADVEVVQGSLVALGQEVGGAQLGNRIVLVMSDITRPKGENLVAAVHEVVHWLADKESPEMQNRIHRAIDALGLGRVAAAESITGDPELRAQERLAYALEAQGIDAISARGWGQRIMRALKDLWYRATMAIQEAFTGGTNPERVIAYFTNRVNSFLAGDQRPISFLNFLGGGKPTVYRQTKFFDPVSDGSVAEYVTFDWDKGTVRLRPMVPTTGEAAVFNIDNGLRQGWKFRTLTGVAEGEQIGGEDPTTRAGWAYGAANKLQKTFQTIYDAFNAGGHNVSSTGGTLLPLNEFIDVLRGDTDRPEKIIADVNEKLNAIQAPLPNPDISIDGPVTFNNDATKQQVRAMTLLHHKAVLSNVSAVFAEETKRRDSLTKQAETKIAKQEKLALKFESLTTTLDALKEGIRDLITQTKADIKSFVKDAKTIGAMTQAIKEFAARIDDPVPAHYEALIDKLANRLFTDAEHFTEFVQDAAALGLNWHGQTMPAIKAELHAIISTNPLFSGMNSEEQNIALAMIGAFARTNDHHIAWLEVRASNAHEARDAIREALNTARKGGTANLNAARDMAARVPGMAAQAQRILIAYNQALQEALTVVQEQYVNGRKLLATSVAIPVLQQAISDLERPLAARNLTPLSVVDGAKLPYVGSDNDTAEQIEKSDPFELRLSGDWKRTPAEVQELRKRYDAWVAKNEATGGAMVETLRDLSHQLKLIDANKQMVGIRQSALARLVGTVADALRGTGTLAGARGAERMTRYSTLVGSHERGPHGLETYGYRAESAKDKAMRALGIKNNKAFDDLIHQAGKGFLEKRKDLQEQPGAHELALGALHAFFLSNPATRPLFKPGVWEKVRAYFEAQVEYNRATGRINKDMGNRIKDDNLGLYRDAIGDPLFTFARGLKPTFEDFFHKIAPEWNGTRRATLKAEEVTAKFTEDPAALAAAIGPMFTDAFWRKWIGEMAARPGRSMFSGRMYAPGKWTIASVENVQRAYREASAVADPGARMLTFAIRIHELEGGPPDAVALHVGETLETVQNYFNALEKIFGDGQELNDRFGIHVGVPRFLMDARVSEDLPTGWLEYQHFDQNHARTAVHRMAFHAAYGRDGSAIASEFNAARKELDDAIESWEDYQHRVGREHPLAKGREVLKLARELAKKEGKSEKDIALMENAKLNRQVVDATEGHFEAWAKLPAQDLTEGKVLLNALSLISSMMVQGPKTAMINTMDLTGGPFIQFGLSTQAIRMVRDNWASFASGAFGSLFNTIGVSFNRDSEDTLRANRLGYGDQDNYVRRRDKVMAEWNAELPGGPIGNAVIRGLRTVRAATQLGVPQAGGVYPTVKPLAPFNLISSWMNLSMIIAHWKMGRAMVGRAVEYYRAHPEAIDDPEFQFTAEHLGYSKGFILDDAQSFVAAREAMARYGMSLETMAKDALKPGAPIITDEDHRALAEMALEEMSLEASPNTAPRWAHQSAARWAMPLLRWSFARTDQLRKSFNEPNGAASLRAMTSGLKIFALVTGVGLAYALLMDEYDDEVTGKKSNIRGFGEQNNLLAVVERTARMGSWGLWGDLANTAGNMAESGDLRGLSFDGRVVFMNSFINLLNGVTTMARQGTADYASVYRQMLGAIGGSGYLQVAQIVNNAFSLDNAEARVTSRINVSNWLRAVGREMGLDVRTTRGGAGAYSLPTKESAYIGQMILAALADDQGDFIQSYYQALSAARDDGKPDPAKYVQQSYAARNPLRTVYVTPPTEDEYNQILARLPASGRSDVQMAVLLINKYGNEIGAPEYEGKKEKVKPPALFTPPSSAQVRRNVAANLFPVYR